MTDKTREAPTVDWQNFVCYLIDKCEGETVSEEMLQRTAADFLRDPQYFVAAQEVKRLREALEETAQSLAWLSFGECRGFSKNLLTSNQALDLARAALQGDK